MTARARFREADLVRVLKAVEKAGVGPSRVEIDPSGKIVILPGDAPPPAAANEWDEVLQ